MGFTVINLFIYVLVFYIELINANMLFTLSTNKL